MINLPKRFDSGCPAEDPVTTCNDPSSSSSDPRSAQYMPALSISPGSVTICNVGQQVQFVASLRSSLGDIPISKALFWSSSDTKVLTIDSSSGLATVVAPGTATVSVQWQGLAPGFAIVNVLSGWSCCDSVDVGTVIALDVSPSMAVRFDAVYPSRLDAAKAIIAHFSAAMNSDKDQMCLTKFDSAAEMVVDFSSASADVRSGLPLCVIRNGQEPAEVVSQQTDIATAIDAALGAFVIPESGGPLRFSGKVAISTPSTGGGSSGGGTTIIVGAAGLHGNGAPDAGLGQPGSTYVDDLTGALYWKSSTGWNPQ